MKTMTCTQLGGACNKKFQANSFQEIAQMSKQHGIEMFQSGDAEHLAVMGKIMQIMQNPEDMQKWMEQKKAEFEALPEDQ